MGRKGTTKNKGRKDELDRFYTKPEVAEDLVKKMLEAHPGWRDTKIFVEPSAGDGAFVAALEKAGIERVYAFDIAPSANSMCRTAIIENDFLEDDIKAKVVELAEAGKEDIVFVGNPPFGEQATLAIAFVKRSLELGQACAFILPLSFYKESTQKRFAKIGGLSQTFDVDDIEYRVVGSEDRKVPSAFFIFDSDTKFVPLPDHSKDLCFSFVSKKEREHADFAIRRVGGTAGTATEDVMGVSVESYYFCKRGEGCPDDVVELINACDFPERDNSVGPRTLSQKEIAKNVYEQCSQCRK